MNLEMVSDRRENSLEASVKVTSRSNFRNHVQKQGKLLKKSVMYRCMHAQKHRQTSSIIILDIRALYTTF